jgi:hypothetical protein
MPESVGELANSQSPHGSGGDDDPPRRFEGWRTIEGDRDHVFRFKVPGFAWVRSRKSEHPKRWLKEEPELAALELTSRDLAIDGGGWRIGSGGDEPAAADRESSRGGETA